MKCKVTNKKITPFMSFGKMPIANGSLEKENFEKEFFFNMEVGFADDISLFQLKDHPKPEQMFNAKLFSINSWLLVLSSNNVRSFIL